MANAGLILAKFCNTMPTELPIARPRSRIRIP